MLSGNLDSKGKRELVLTRARLVAFIQAVVYAVLQSNCSRGRKTILSLTAYALLHMRITLQLNLIRSQNDRDNGR
ncbi:hypothetical protein V6N13_018445 [Hibiscus sabdariffa]